MKGFWNDHPAAQLLRYAAAVVIGVKMALPLSMDVLGKILATISPVTLTALVASLLIPFAAFSKEEWLQKFVVKYAAVPIFGMYGVLSWRIAGVTGVCAFAMVMGGHFGYWMSSIQSRGYRLKQAELWLTSSVGQIREIAKLNMSGDSHIADQRVVDFFRQMGDGQ